MNGSDPQETARERAGRHAVAAAVACGISLVAHALLLLYLAHTRWRLLDVIRESLPVSPPSAVSVKLEEVRRERPPDVPGTAATREGQGPGGVGVSARPGELHVPPGAGVLQPPALSVGTLAGETRSLVSAAPGAPRTGYEPRQEIVAIEKRIVPDEDATIKRREIDRIERVRGAPDITTPQERRDAERAVTTAEQRLTGDPTVRGAPSGQPGGLGTGRGGSPLRVDDPRARIGPDVPEPGGVPVRPRRHIEDLLIAEMSTYTTFWDRKNVYFRIGIRRKDPALLPVIAKDLLFVQDCSASITEQKLYFCREALRKCLPLVGPKDRFNVIGFREGIIKCFDDWAPNNSVTQTKAASFIEGMQSAGNTDILTAVSELKKIQGKPGRPVIAIMVSDGHPTSGVTDSSDIITQFTALNEGAVSVFTMNTSQTANFYLLDLLSYCNRGSTAVVTGGRWGIPGFAQGLAKEVSRPVLSDVRFRFSAGAGVEVYPVLTSNLYLDRTLYVHGRCSRDQDRVVFQAVGRADDVDCDMVFDLDLRKADTGGEDIMTGWAKHKVYALISETARQDSPALRKKIEETARTYRIKIPYRGKY